ncbi:CcmD family protein [Paucidesulfovibrio gracilis DSM 16080]|uniref:CcmD family protein n=1 Tax=Paucidesulfovibrio gracilis DSM 16080 TaxID=1121449 RepID=A0A1T4W106_9BACT|nr:CcmD family protein [Paucidesulfovibrio gracilis]SKA70877.1 CcmD family protein [Paucidesulfovibrio gracilis DSM 16080]
MSSSLYITLANVAVWGGLAAYGVFLMTRNGRLNRRAKQLELLRND